MALETADKSLDLVIIADEAMWKEVDDHGACLYNIAGRGNIASNCLHWCLIFEECWLITFDAWARERAATQIVNMKSGLVLSNASMLIIGTLVHIPINTKRAEQERRMQSKVQEVIAKPSETSDFKAKQEGCLV